MTKVVFNPFSDSFSLKHSVVRRYFEILAELNPGKDYIHSYQVDLSCNVEENPEFDDQIIIHFLNGKFWNEARVVRDCPALVRLVEETGGQCVDDGQAVIVEIPDDVEWEIFSWDHDREEIHEKHRSWSFNAEQNQVVCYDDRERKTEQIDEAILLIDEVTDKLKHANNLLKLNFKGGRSKKIRQSLLALAEVLKEEEALTKES
jgi:hypothetical protein